MFFLSVCTSTPLNTTFLLKSFVPSTIDNRATNSALLSMLLLTYLHDCILLQRMEPTLQALPLVEYNILVS